jgi:hypothetical protein
MTMNENATCLVNPISMHKIYGEGNMVNIDEMIPIDISKTHGVIENVFIGVYCSCEEIHIYTELFKQFCNVFSWSYEEMLGIDLRIVEHEITTYHGAKLVQQKLHLVNPCKEDTIKVEVEKLIKVGFIYPVQLTVWVSNPLTVKKNKV